MSTNKTIFETKMNALADSINTKAGLTGKKDLDEMKDAVDGIVVPSGNQDITTLDEYDVSAKATARISATERAKIIPGNIVTGQTILGVSGSAVVPSGNQDVTTLSEYDVTAKATARVSATERAKIIAENIKKDVTILGITGTYEGSGGGGTKPAYLISDGDTVSAFYFNTAYSLATFLSGLTYDQTDPTYGFSYAYLSFGYLIAIDLSSITGAGLTGYVLFWGDPDGPEVIYSTTTFDLSAVMPGMVVTTAGWQVTSLTPESSVTVDFDLSNAGFVAIVDNVVAQEAIAFGSTGGGKAHTFQIPTVSGTYTYTGSSQTVSITGYYSDFMTKSGTSSATSAGNYTVTISLTDTTNCQWSDGTTTAKTLNWSIAKAALPKPTLSEGAITLSASQPSATFTVSRAGNGTVSATSSNPSRIVASVSGTTVTLTASDTSTDASANIVVTVAEGTNYLAYTAQDVVCVASIETAITKTTAFITVTAASTQVPILYKMDASGKTMVIDWGDGNSDTYSSNLTTYNLRNHTYANAGSYRITFTPTAGATWTPGAYYKKTGSSWEINYNIFNLSSGEPTNISLTRFVSKGDVVTLSGSAFSSTSIEEVDMSDGLTGLRSDVFSGCASLVRAVLGSITLCETETGGNAGSLFRNCTSLTSVIFGDGTTTWGAYGSNFEYCAALTSFVIPAGITSVGGQFNGCTSLMELTCKATTPPAFYSSQISKLPAACAIYVPAASVASYKAATGWSDRADYIQAIPAA